MLAEACRPIADLCDRLFPRGVEDPVPGVGQAEVNLVWDPPWDPAKMSDDAKLELGML